MMRENLMSAQDMTMLSVNANSFVRAIVYGSHAVPLEEKREDGHTHRWKIYVRPWPEGSNMSHYVRKVVITLHESFAVPNRTFEKEPYEVTETGWGEFEVPIKIFFHDPALKPVSFLHHLQLYDRDAPMTDTLPPPMPVLAERYEELLLHNPSPAGTKALANHELVYNSAYLAARAANERGFGEAGERERVEALRQVTASLRAKEEGLLAELASLEGLARERRGSDGDPMRGRKKTG